MIAPVYNMSAEADNCTEKAYSEALISQAHTLAPKLRERSPQCDQDRKISQDTIDDLLTSGLLCQPKQTLRWDTICEVGQILASACGSQAWVYWVFANHALMLSAFTPEARSEVWGTTGRYQFISASLDPVGRACPVDGGVVYSGSHRFASGIDYADWLICGGFLDRGDNREGPYLFLLPKSQVVVIDDWDTIGLRGTGSKSFRVTDTFVPQHRCLRVSKSDGSAFLVPGTDESDTEAAPRGEGITSSGFVALAVGMARGVLEEWVAYTGSRKSRGLAIAQQDSTQILLAQCAAEIDAAEALYLGYLSTLLNKGANRNILQSERITSKRNGAFACQLVLQAGTRLFNSAGGRALYAESALQRQYRNLLAATAHHAVSWNNAAVEYGGSVFNSQRHAVPFSAG
jgi:alkylation response protein AidB-like acyl-CoA dehydrogenase